MNSGQKSQASQSSKGFTLIELLVVIAIIAIIAAILFPVFASTREKARETTCLSNQKEIGLALMQYVTDNDEVFPQASYASNNPASPHWMDFVYPFIRSAEVFECPDRAADPTNMGNEVYTPDTTGAWTRPGDQFGAYYMNGTWAQTNGPAATSPIAVQVSKIQSVSNTILVAEAPFPWGWQGSAGNTYGTNAVINFPVTSTSSCNPVNLATPKWFVPGNIPPDAEYNGGSSNHQALVFPHFGRTNVIFCDGHAKNEGPADVLQTEQAGGGCVDAQWWGAG